MVGIFCLFFLVWRVFLVFYFFFEVLFFGFGVFLVGFCLAFFVCLFFEGTIIFNIFPPFPLAREDGFRRRNQE